MTSIEKKWWRVYQVLRSRILLVPPGTPLGKTRMDLAREFGVNHKTVNRAIQVLKSEGLLLAGRGKSLRVNPKIPGVFSHGAGILYVADRSGWNSFFMMQMTMAVLRRLKEQELNFRLVYLDEFEEVLPYVRTGKVVGALVSYVMGVGRESEVTRRLNRMGIPLCTIDYSLPGIDSVEFDNISLGRKLGRWLFTQKSFRRVLLCSRTTYAKPEREREEGITQILDELSVPHSRVEWRGAFTPGDVRRLTTFFEAGERFDAVFVHFIGLKSELEKTFRASGVPVPPIFSIGIRETLARYGLSGVAVSSASLGERALELLMKRRKEPHRPAQKVLCDESSIYEHAAQREREGTV